jgi:hypothetical protein
MDSFLGGLVKKVLAAGDKGGWRVRASGAFFCRGPRDCESSSPGRRRWGSGERSDESKGGERGVFFVGFDRPVGL